MSYVYQEYPKTLYRMKDGVREGRTFASEADVEPGWVDIGELDREPPGWGDDAPVAPAATAAAAEPEGDETQDAPSPPPVRRARPKAQV